jgi:hypothetical protein
MKKGCYTAVADKLQRLLDVAREPGADYPDIALQVRHVDYGMTFPDRSPVIKAKDAVLRCLGPKLYARNSADAIHQISSCQIADNQFFDTDGNLT